MLLQLLMLQYFCFIKKKKKRHQSLSVNSNFSGVITPYLGLEFHKALLWTLLPVWKLGTKTTNFCFSASHGNQYTTFNTGLNFKVLLFVLIWLKVLSVSSVSIDFQLEVSVLLSELFSFVHKRKWVLILSQCSSCFTMHLK